MIGIIILVVLVAPLIVFGLMVLHRHMKYPEKSLFYAFVNTLLYPVRLLKLGPYKYGKPSVENGLKYAVRKTKLSDFNGTEFIDNYKAVYDSDFYKIHKYSNIGMYIAGLEINLTFARRLMLVDYFKRFPQISSVPVRSPVFLTGLPRTGTTFMQRLLSLDPNVSYNSISQCNTE